MESTNYRNFKKNKKENPMDDIFDKILSGDEKFESTNWNILCEGKYLKRAVYHFLIDRNFKFRDSFEESPIIYINFEKGYFTYKERRDADKIKHSMPYDWKDFVIDVNNTLKIFPIDFFDNGLSNDVSLSAQAEQLRQKEKKNAIEAIRRSREILGVDIDQNKKKSEEIRIYYTNKANLFFAKFMSRKNPDYSISNGAYVSEIDFAKKNNLLGFIGVVLGNNINPESYLRKNQKRHDFILEVLEILGFDFLNKKNQVQKDHAGRVYIFPEEQHTTYFKETLDETENPAEGLKTDNKNICIYSSNEQTDLFIGDFKCEFNKYLPFGEIKIADSIISLSDEYEIGITTNKKIADISSKSSDVYKINDFKGDVYLSVIENDQKMELHSDLDFSKISKIQEGLTVVLSFSSGDISKL